MKVSFLLFFIVATVMSRGQSNDQFIFHHLGFHDGLLGDEINATAQDEKGFIWIGGKNGLQRYDGFRFLNFKSRAGDSTSIPHNNIESLQVDNKDRIWLITSDFKCGFFDAATFRFHAVKAYCGSKLLNKVTAIFELDEKKNILVILRSQGNEPCGVLTYDEKRDALTDGDKRFELPADWRIGFLSIDSTNGNLWLGTTNGLVKYDPGTGHHNYRGHNPDNDPIISAFSNFTAISHPLLDKHGNFWAMTFRSGAYVELVEYIAKDKKVVNRTSELIITVNYVYNEVHNILLDNEGHTWLTGLNMLIRVTDDNKFEVVQNESPQEYSIHFDDLRTMRIDREHNIWLSTNKGVYWFNPSATIFHTMKNKRPGSEKIYTPDISDIKQLHDGTILVATWGNGLFAYNKNFQAISSPVVEQGIQSGEGLTWAIHERKNGDVWRGQQDGYLIIYHKSENRTEKLQLPVFEKKTIRQIAEDRNGDLWLGTQSGAVVKWIAATNTFTSIKRMPSLVKRIYADKNGDIWIIAEGVVKMDINTGNVLEAYTVEKGDGKHLLSKDLSDIIQYNDSIYIIAGEGLNILNHHTHHFTYLTTNDGILSDYISNIIEDKNNNLWLSTEGGIFVFNLSSNMNSSYGMEDGIVNNNFNYATSCRLDDGRILFGTNHDFISFDPDNLNGADFMPPTVEVTAVKLFNKRLPLDSLMKLDRIDLAHEQNSLTFEFSTLTYQTRYPVSYKMNGIDKSWTTVSAGSEAVYSYLPPGDYAFQLGSPDAHGVVQNIHSLNIHIGAPFWRTWKFYAVLVIIAAVIAWYFYKERMKRMKDMLSMRNTIGKDLHKEVRSTLKNISVLSEIAAMKADHNLEQSKDYIQEIKQKSRSTVIAMDDVMWSIDPANDSIEKTTERIHEIAEILQNEYGTVVEIEIEDSLRKYHMTMKQRLEFIMLYKRAMLLLCREVRSPVVNVMVELKNNDIVLEIFAEGTQLPKYDQKVVADIEEIKSRASAVDGMADIQSDAKGTAVIAQLGHRTKI